MWEGGKILGSFTYGEGVGRYILNGAGQDAFVNADGSLSPITSMGATLGISQKITNDVTGALAVGYYQVDDTFAATDTETLTTAHASLFWNPLDNVTIGAEAIYGERELANGQSDDAVRLQSSFQVNF